MTEMLKQEIIRKYSKGVVINMICKELPVTYWQVFKIINANKIKRTLCFNKLTESQIDFFISNYPLMGARRISSDLKTPISTIERWVCKLDLHVNKDVTWHNRSRIHLGVPKRRPFSELNVNPDQFFKIRTKEVCYILGILWGDGHIALNRGHSVITINNTLEDTLEFEKTFFKTGKWSTYIGQKRNWKPYKILKIGNIALAEFLCDNDYHIKSVASPDKILNKIPDKLKHYFFRGFFDADGHISKLPRYHCSIAGSFEQNWASVEKLFKKLKIVYKIRKKQFLNKKTKKINKSSFVAIDRKADCKKFMTFIYKNREKDKIGLTRKYKRWLELKNKL